MANQSEQEYDILDKILQFIERRFPTLGIPILIIKSSALSYRFFNFGIVVVGNRSSGKSAVMSIGASGRSQSLTVSSVAGFAKAINKGYIQLPEDGHIFFVIDDLADITQYNNRIDSFMTLMSSLMFTGQVAYMMGNEIAFIKDCWASVTCGGTLGSYEKVRRRDDWDAKNVDRFPLRIHLTYRGEEYNHKERLSRVWEFLGKEKLVEYWMGFGQQIDMILGIKDKDLTEFVDKMILKYDDKLINFNVFKETIDRLLSEGKSEELYKVLPEGLNKLIVHMRTWINASESRLTCAAMSLAIFHALANKRYIIIDQDFLWWIGKIDRYIKPDCISGVSLVYYYALMKDGQRVFEKESPTRKELVILTKLKKKGLIEVLYKGVGQTRKIAIVIPK